MAGESPLFIPFGEIIFWITSAVGVAASSAARAAASRGTAALFAWTRSRKRLHWSHVGPGWSSRSTSDNTSSGVAEKVRAVSRTMKNSAGEGGRPWAFRNSETVNSP